MIIALNQLQPKSGEPEANLKLMEKTIKQNSLDGAKLCVFPEDFLYGILRQRSDIAKAAAKFDYWLGRYKALAQKYKVDIVPGSQPTGHDGELFNTAVYINHKGEVCTKYSKTNLWLTERDEYVPSLEPPQVFDSVLGKTAIIICWDILDHRAFESAVKNGAEWIICVSLWSINQSNDLERRRGKSTLKYRGFSDATALTSLIPTRAYEYNVGMIFCNIGGVLEYTDSLGQPDKAISASRTQIVTPCKQQYKALHSRKPATLLFRLDVPMAFEEIADTEKLYGRHEDIASSYPYTTTK